MQNIKALLQQLQSVIQMAGQITAYQQDIDQALQQVYQSTRQLYDQMVANESQIQAATGMSPAQLEQLRVNITYYRMAIRQIAQSVDDINEVVTQSYRNVLQKGKDQFESLTFTQQQQTNPQAFYLRQAFLNLSQLKEKLHQMSGQLMDLSHGLEHSILDQRPTPETPPIEDRNYRDEGPVNRLISP